jgi:hypothetical protein
MTNEKNPDPDAAFSGRVASGDLGGRRLLCWSHPQLAAAPDDGRVAFVMYEMSLVVARRFGG